MNVILVCINGREFRTGIQCMLYISSAVYLRSIGVVVVCFILNSMLKNKYAIFTSMYKVFSSNVMNELNNKYM
mgnify:CR=1 FL=1